MKKVLLLFAFLACFVGGALAQDRTVSGKVTDSETGEPLPGVNIQVKGTSQGTVTDADGNFKLSISGSPTLVFTFIGFKPQEVVVGSQSTINVSLKNDADMLSEVVITGYGQQDKKSLSGSAAVVKAEAIRNVPIGIVRSDVARASTWFAYSGKFGTTWLACGSTDSGRWLY